MTEDKTPESIDDVKKRVFAKTWKALSNSSPRKKWIIGLTIMVLAVIPGRFGFLGEPALRVCKGIFPFHIPIIDEEIPVIPFTFNYQIVDPLTGLKEGKQGETIQSGTQLIFTFKPGEACWATIFCVDEAGLHPVFGNDLNPLKVQKGEPYTIRIELDNTLGTEIYYAVVNPKKFNFASDIKPRLEKQLPMLNPKGPQKAEWDFDLPTSYRKKWIHFDHAPR